jgi:ribosomal protein S18 acetylase RimI-like enzyme
VIHYRTFRNPDPPALVAIWNGLHAGRGAITLRVAALLEYFTFAKPFFDPQGLILAEDEGRPVGFAHAGFGPSPAGDVLDHAVGVTCALGVLPSHRRRGIGTELLRRCEDYLRRRGARELLAGPQAPRNPFTFGLYGGGDSPGFLDSDPLARPFLEGRGYRVSETRLVFQRPLDRAPNPPDARFPAHRQRYEVRVGPYSNPTWWRECVLGPAVDRSIEYRLIDRGSERCAGRVALWEMDTFSQQWGRYAVGVLDLEVAPPLRRQGLAKFLFSQVLRHLHEQVLHLIEVQAAEDNAAALGLLRGLGFTQVDVGRCYRAAQGPTGGPT